MSCFLYDSYKEFSDYSILLYVSPLYSLSPWGVVSKWLVKINLEKSLCSTSTPIFTPSSPLSLAPPRYRL